MNNRLKELRKDKGLSLNALRLILNDKYDIKVSNSQLMYYENGVRSPRSAKIWEALADYFEVNVGYLLGYLKSPRTTKELVTSSRELVKELELDQELVISRFYKTLERSEEKIDLLMEFIESYPKDTEYILASLSMFKENLKILELDFNNLLFSSTMEKYGENKKSEKNEDNHSKQENNSD